MDDSPVKDYLKRALGGVPIPHTTVCCQCDGETLYVYFKVKTRTGYSAACGFNDYAGNWREKATRRCFTNDECDHEDGCVIDTWIPFGAFPANDMPDVDIVTEEQETKECEGFALSGSTFTGDELYSAAMDDRVINPHGTEFFEVSIASGISDQWPAWQDGGLSTTPYRVIAGTLINDTTSVNDFEVTAYKVGPDIEMNVTFDVVSYNEHLEEVDREEKSLLITRGQELSEESVHIDPPPNIGHIQIENIAIEVGQ